MRACKRTSRRNTWLSPAWLCLVPREPQRAASPLSLSLPLSVSLLVPSRAPLTAVDATVVRQGDRVVGSIGIRRSKLDDIYGVKGKPGRSEER